VQEVFCMMFQAGLPCQGPVANAVCGRPLNLLPMLTEVDAGDGGGARVAPGLAGEAVGGSCVGALPPVAGCSALWGVRGCGGELRVSEEQPQLSAVGTCSCKQRVTLRVLLWGHGARHVGHRVVFVPQSFSFRTMT